MPKATAPSKNGYVFGGYYSATNDCKSFLFDLIFSVDFVGVRVVVVG